MPKDAADRRTLLRILGAARARLDVVRGTPADIAAQVAFNRAQRMLDLFDGHPSDETPSPVVRYLWRPWEAEHEGRPRVHASGAHEQPADVERNADVARATWTRA